MRSCGSHLQGLEVIPSSKPFTHGLVSWRFPDLEWTHGHGHRHGWALVKQIVPHHVFGEDDKRGICMHIHIGNLNVKSLNLGGGGWLYLLDFSDG